MDFKTLEQEVLSKITPTKEENAKIDSIKRKIEARINEVLKESNLKDISPKLVGSVAKDTHLKQVDLDIFIMFPPETSREELEDLGLMIGRKVIPDADELYAEHPYLRGKLDGLQIDLVPCYHVKDSSFKLSAVDRTPFHMEYVQKNLKEDQKNDVRLFKQFLKGIGAYGAEIRVQGFSGYLCELLVMEFSGFHKLLEAVGHWDVPGRTTIIPSSVQDGFDRAGLAKFTEPLILIDPVDTSRNVASPVSEDILFLLKNAARDYLAEPSNKFFFPNKTPVMTSAELKDEILRLDELLVGIEINTANILDDILYGQVRKSLKAAIKLLEHYDFSIARSDFYVKIVNDETRTINIFLIMLVDCFELPEKLVHRGPPVSHENAKSFLEKWKSVPSKLSEPYQDNKRWFVDIKRDYTSALELLNDKIPELNHGKLFNISIQKGNYSVLSGPELADSEWTLQLSEFLLNKRPWEY